MPFAAIQSPDKRFTLEYSVETGGSILSFRAGGLDIFRPYDSALPLAPLNTASFPLTPYSNRIIGGKLEFGGEVFDVGPRKPDDLHQLHGDGWLLPWRVEAETPDSVTMHLRTEKAAHTPYAYDARQTYRLDDKGLEISMSVTNTGGRALPFGLGHHPYFPRNAQTKLTANLPKVWNSRRIVPTDLADTPPQWDFSRGLTLGDDKFGPPSQGMEGRDLLDHCFTGWDQTARIDWPDRTLSLTITADPVFAQFVIYIPAEKPFFCAEPVTNINDGFNLQARGIADTGTVVLQPGETLIGKMRFDIA